MRGAHARAEGHGAKQRGTVAPAQWHGGQAPAQRGGGQAPARRRGGRGRRLLAALPYIVIVAGLVLLAYPIATSWWEAWEASRNIQQVTDVYDAMNDPERTALYEDALRYNELLATERAGKPLAADPIVPAKAEAAGEGEGDGPAGVGDTHPSGGAAGAGASGGAGAASAQVSPYERQLSFQGSEMIAHISIPKCSIRLPIFHGTEDKALMAGVGHMKGSSLPAGGATSHCVLTAHTGIPGKRMFDDIRLLQPGDRFVVWVLGRPLAYEVTGSEEVLPDQTASLVIREGEDLMTLVTCTPVGVNSHRLLVHAKRCDYEEGEEQQADTAVYVNDRTAPLLVALGVLAVLAVALVALRLRRKRMRA